MANHALVCHNDCVLADTIVRTVVDRDGLHVRRVVAGDDLDRQERARSGCLAHAQQCAQILVLDVELVHPHQLRLKLVDLIAIVGVLGGQVTHTLHRVDDMRRLVDRARNAHLDRCENKREDLFEPPPRTRD